MLNEKDFLYIAINQSHTNGRLKLHLPSVVKVWKFSCRLNLILLIASSNKNDNGRELAKLFYILIDF